MICWRAERLVEKMLSIKFLIFVVATVLKCFSVIGNGEWLTIAITVIAGREVQKIKDFRFKKVVNEEGAASD